MLSPAVRREKKIFSPATQGLQIWRYWVAQGMDLRTEEASSEIPGWTLRASASLPPPRTRQTEILLLPTASAPPGRRLKEPHVKKLNHPKKQKKQLAYWPLGSWCKVRCSFSSKAHYQEGRPQNTYIHTYTYTHTPLPSNQFSICSFTLMYE